jgi:hypothetical protein
MPIRRADSADFGELGEYLGILADHLEVIVVDGSALNVFQAHATMLDKRVVHIGVDPDRQTTNGKVGGVLTGLDRASHERVVIADDDVRYDLATLERLVTLLDSADIVRPQNYFRPLPWHTRLDTARSLLNRMMGGDWPGTLGVRRSLLMATGGYDGNVMFENLELVRTVRAAGGTEVVPLDLYVRRSPPDVHHFWSQRTRQAYDELARPARLIISLGILPSIIGLTLHGKWKQLAIGAGILVGLAEIGRQRADGRRYFPASCSLLAPIWLLERALCIWLALGARIFLGGVPYRGNVIRRAATPMRTLKRPHAMAHGPGRREESRKGTVYRGDHMVER